MPNTQDLPRTSGAGLSLDADTVGHYLTFLTMFRGWSLEALRRNLITDVTFASRCYQTGSLEVRLLVHASHGVSLITQHDLDLLEEWEEEYNAANPS